MSSIENNCITDDLSYSEENNEYETEWYISNPSYSQDQMLKNELFDNWFKPTVTTVGYQSPSEEMQDIYKANIKIKQVIAEQPINTEESKCNYSCDIEN